MRTNFVVLAVISGLVLVSFMETSVEAQGSKRRITHYTAFDILYSIVLY